MTKHVSIKWGKNHHLTSLKGRNNIKDALWTPEWTSTLQYSLLFLLI